jgi:hypothetical protein
VKKVLVLMPAGVAQAEGGKVASHYVGNPEKSIAYQYNVGDMYVYDSSLRILQPDQIEVVNAEAFMKSPSQEMLDYYNTFDYCFLRGSNYINPNGEWDAKVALLEKLTIPVIAFGVGVQVIVGSNNYMNASTERFFRLVAERSKTIGVRGAYSAEVLAEFGIKNSRVIGCPTAFRSLKPVLKFNKPNLDALQSVGFTLRRMTHGSNNFQRYLLRYLSDRFSTTIICAGELEEKILYYAFRESLKDSAGHVQRVSKTLVEKGWFYDEKDPLLDCYRKGLFFDETVAGYEECVRRQQLVLGFRLHGNLLALANEVPAIYVTYDSRTREFVETFKMPSYDVAKAEKFSFSKAMEELDFTPFEKAYAHQFKQLQTFLKENGMGPSGAAATG